MSQTFSSLQFHNYRLWFGSALIANIGTWMQRVAQDWLVLTVLTQDSGVALGITTALQFVPTLLFSAWAGVLADRVNRRKLLIATQTALAGLAIGLGLLVLSGMAELWHVYAFAFALGCVSAVDNPVRQTFVAELVPMEKLPNAVGLNSASFNAARLIGPGVAGLLIAAVGIGWVFIINGVSFAATVIALIVIRQDELHRMPSVAREKGQIRAGIAYVRGRTDIIVIMVVIGVVSALGLNFQMTSALMARVEFGKGAGEYGVLGSVLAIGSLSGALIAARRELPRVRLVVLAALGFGISSGIMALAPNYLTFALFSIPVGFCSLTMMTGANAAIQMSTEPQMRGRVMALYLVVFLGATPVGSPIVGWVGENWGPRWAIGIGAISAIAVALWAIIWTRHKWHYEVSYSWRRWPYVQVSYANIPATGLTEPLDDELDALDESSDILGGDSREHRDA